MDRIFLIQLTNKLYQLTLLFPKKEPLRYKMRELADEILANFYKDQNPAIFKILEVLDSFFEVTKNQSWASQNDILSLQEEYSKLREEFKDFKQSPQALEKIEVTQPEARFASNFSNSRHGKILDSNPPTTRQGRILEFLKEKGRAQVWEMKQVFPEVSKRTLRRDCEQMVNQGIIERMGEKNDTFYQIKG